MPTPTGHFADVSHWEPNCDFHAMAAAGALLAITKATQGGSNTDPTYQGYAARVRSVPLILGSYCFEEAEAEAPQIAHYIATAHLQSGDLMPVVDAEALGLTQAETFAALEDLEARGYTPILYCSLAFYEDVLGSPTRWWLWLAAYRDALPALPAAVKLFAWQHTQCGAFPGVAKPCDCNYLYVSQDDLQALLIP